MRLDAVLNVTAAGMRAEQRTSSGRLTGCVAAATAIALTTATSAPKNSCAQRSRDALSASLSAVPVSVTRPCASQVMPIGGSVFNAANNASAFSAHLDVATAASTAILSTRFDSPNAVPAACSTRVLVVASYTRPSIARLSPSVRTVNVPGVFAALCIGGGGASAGGTGVAAALAASPPQQAPAGAARPKPTPPRPPNH